MPSITPETPGKRAMRKDPAFPDVDTDVRSLLEGPVKAMRHQALWLKTCLNRHQDIDPDFWLELRDLAESVLIDTATVLCVDCLELGQHTLGEAVWTRDRFDGLLCKAHGEQERTR